MRRTVTTLGVTALLALSGVVALATQAGAGGGEMLAAPLTVEKAVSGPVPEGTTFTVTIQCSGPIIDTEGPAVASALMTFDATGAPLDLDTIGFVDEGTCSVTETASGGASTVAYACQGGVEESSEEPPVEPGVDAAGEMPFDPCTAVGATGVQISVELEDQFAFVTVTNTFVEPEPADVVVVQPAFTG